LPHDASAQSKSYESWFRRVQYGPEERSDYVGMVAALRDFLDKVAGARPDAQAMAALTQDLNAWSERLEAYAVSDRDQPFGRLYSRPGRAQAMAPAITITEAKEGDVRGKVTFGRYFLGVNGAVHGGAIPLVFDEILGNAASSRERGRVRTAYLNVDFRSLTPLDTELEIHCWLDRVDGRKLFVRGELRNGDVVCASAEGLFIELRPEQG
jgi:acyl-coenzyme A thioesterase PaaI-like protein